MMNLAAFRKFANAPETTGCDFSILKDGRVYESIKQRHRNV